MAKVLRHGGSTGSPPAQDERGCAAGADPHKSARVQAGRHRKVQLARTGGRKLFGKAAKKLFLEWFAATCNIKWSAEMAGFNYKTVLRHRMNDPLFAADFDRAMAQGYARLEAKRLETRRRDVPIGIEGDWDVPEMDEMDPERMDAILRERGRQLVHPEMARKQGRRPRIASNAEVRAALEKRLKAYHARERARLEKAPLPLDGGMDRSPCPPDMASDRGAIRTSPWVGVDCPSGTARAESPPPPQPSGPQVRPPDEPKGGPDPIKGEGEKE